MMKRYVFINSILFLILFSFGAKGQTIGKTDKYESQGKINLIQGQAIPYKQSELPTSKVKKEAIFIGESNNIQKVKEEHIILQAKRITEEEYVQMVSNKKISTIGNASDNKLKVLEVSGEAQPLK